MSPLEQAEWTSDGPELAAQGRSQCRLLTPKRSFTRYHLTGCRWPEADLQ